MVASSVACLTCIKVDLKSVLVSGIFLLDCKHFYGLNTRILPQGGLPRNSVARIIDSPNVTLAVDCGPKILHQLKLHYAD